MPVKGAECKLTNDSGAWFIPSTPGTVTIDRCYGDLTVQCNKGDYTGSTSVQSKTKAMAFGNIVAGGIIGGAVDAGTGAAYDYPTSIMVPMQKK